jgi:hypothetical protein
VCQPPINNIFYPTKILPSVLHFCQFFRVGEYGFQKRRIKTNFFDCDQPLMAHLPIELGTMTYKNRDGSVSSINININHRRPYHDDYHHISYMYIIVSIFYELLFIVL